MMIGSEGDANVHSMPRWEMRNEPTSPGAAALPSFAVVSFVTAVWRGCACRFLTPPHALASAPIVAGWFRLTCRVPVTVLGC
jgi:hypothetical protein